MKSLFLLRHAKSSWDDPALDDFDRPLAPRGLAAAPKMAKEMARWGWLPDFALVSSARRTRETFSLITEAIGSDIAHRFDLSIYEAPASRNLDAIRTAPPESGTLLVVGHNPAMEDLAHAIAGPASDRDAFALLNEKFPTAALARFSLEGPWEDLAADAARLTHFIRPRDLP